MKRWFVFCLILALFCASLLMGRSSSVEKEQPVVVYSFSGENPFLSVSNGVIVLNAGKETFYGGDLEVKGEEFADIAGYTVTVYLMDGERILLSNSVVDETGGTIDVSGDIGKVSGDVLRDEDTEKIADDLWLTLQTTDLRGEENTYQLPLEVVEVTATAAPQ